MPSSHEPLTPPDAAPAPVRLDAQMQKRVIARALELQRQQQDTLTPEQLEAVAAEAGIEPVFVRQAVVQVAAERPALEGGEENLHGQHPPSLWSHKWTVAAGLGAAALVGSVSGAGAMPDLALLIPSGAAWVGGLLSRRRRAFQAGAAMGGVGIVALEVAHRAVHPQATISIELDLFWVALCAGSGVLGAAIRRSATGRRSSPAVGADSAPSQD